MNFILIFPNSVKACFPAFSCSNDVAEIVAYNLLSKNLTNIKALLLYIC